MEGAGLMVRVARNFLLCLLVVACSREVPAPIRHDGPPTRDNSEKKLEDRSGSRFPLKKEIDELRKLLNSEDANLYLKIIEPLSPFILSEEALRDSDPEVSAGALRVFNAAIAIEYKKEDRRKEIIGLLEAYEKILFAGCTHGLGGCKNLIPFMNARNTPEVLKVLSQVHRGDASSVYRYLSLAYELKGGVYDPELDRLYIGNMDRFVSVVEATSDPKLRKFLSLDHAERLRYAAKNYTEHGGDQTAVISECDLWEDLWAGENSSIRLLNLRRSVRQVKKDLRLELIISSLYEGECAKNDGSDSGRKCRLNPGLRRIITKHEEQPSSISMRLRHLRKEHQTIFNGLGITEFQTDEYFFIVDRVFQNRMDLDEARIIWQASLKDEDAFFRVLENYVRSEFAFMILYSNREIKENFYDRKLWTSEGLLWEGLQETQALGRQWKDLLRRLGRLQGLAKVVFSTDGKKGEYFDRARYLFQSLPDNIKYMVVYPNMMHLAYKLAEANFEVTFLTMFGSVTIDSKFVIKLFFSAKFEPWFDFGNDDKKLNRYGIIHAFDYALKTETFRSYGVSAIEAVSKLYEELLEPHRVKIRNAYNSLKEKYKGDAALSRFLTICQALKKDLPYSNSVKLENLRYSPFLGKWAEQLYMTGLHAIFSFNEPDIVVEPKNVYAGTSTEMVEWIRTDVAYDILIFEGILSSYRAHAGDLSNPGTSDRKTLLQVERKLKDLKDARNAFIRSVLGLHRQFGDCEGAMFGQELSVQRGLLLKEVSYFRQVFRDMTDFREGRRSSPVKYSPRSLPAEVHDFSDTFDEHTFYSYTLNFWLRMKDYLKDGVDPNTRVVVPGNLTKVEPFEDMFVNPDFMKIPYIDWYGTYEENEREFVRIAFANLRPGGFDSKLRWLAYGGYHSFWYEKQELMMALYRLGPISGGVVGDPAPPRDISVSDLIEEQKLKIRLVNISPEDTILFDLWDKKSLFDRGSHYRMVELWDFIIDCDDFRPLPFFDYIYSMAVAPLLSYYFEGESSKRYPKDASSKPQIKRHGYLEEARLYFKARKELSKNFVSVSTGLEKFFDAKLKTMVDYEIYVEKSVREAIFREEKINALSPQEKKRRGFRDEPPLKINILQGEVSYGPFLDPIRVENGFKPALKKFHLNTENFYRE